MITGLNLLEKLSPTGLEGATAPVPAAKATDIAGSFAAALSEATGNAVATLGRAETLSIQALQGEAQTRDVVDAVMSAEQSLQTTIAIRDKIVTAFLEISRMQI